MHTKFYKMICVSSDTAYIAFLAVLFLYCHVLSLFNQLFLQLHIRTINIKLAKSCWPDSCLEVLSQSPKLI